MSAVVTPLMTIEQFLALADEEMDQELIQGRLRERPMTVRNRFHSRAVANVVYILEAWLKSQPRPRGEVHCGDVGCILRREPDTIVGIDVAYFSPEVMERQTGGSTLVDGAPKLAVEALSPSDRHEEIHEKVMEHLHAGVEMVWLVDPYFQTVQVHRPGRAPEMFNLEQRVSGADALPGLEFAVRDIFS